FLASGVTYSDRILRASGRPLCPPDRPFLISSSSSQASTSWLNASKVMASADALSGLMREPSDSRACSTSSTTSRACPVSVSITSSLMRRSRGPILLRWCLRHRHSRLRHRHIVFRLEPLFEGLALDQRLDPARDQGSPGL